ncbi:MAG: hypothetical protein H3C30_10820 [Candidatus Hydrogenedentes bacterium]|nr:hypothetical protein [Candidatus Hydrogenedentota bacterium]
MLTERHTALLFAASLLLLSVPAQADMSGLAPLSFPFPFFSRIEMRDASVNIVVNVPDLNQDVPLTINVEATFHMKDATHYMKHSNSEEETIWNVQFPWNMFGDMEKFKVISCGFPKETTNDYKARCYSWQEHFKPGVERIIKVEYEIKVRKMIKDEIKAVLPAEKRINPYRSINSKPRPRNQYRGTKALIRSLESETAYFLFDYSLTSGATWDGPIGRETVNLTFLGWAPQKVLCNQADRLIQKDSSTWTYQLINEDPTSDLYFALSAH